MEAIMKKIPLMVLSALVIVSLIMPCAASAMCRQRAALDTCYNDCRSYFTNDLQVRSCYLGCVIGCAISDAS